MTEVTHSQKASTDADTRDALSRMERDWDLRAREAPEYYIASARRQWRMDEFFQAGEINVDNDIRADANIIWRGSSLLLLATAVGIAGLVRRSRQSRDRR